MKQLKMNEVAEWNTVALQFNKEELEIVMIGLTLTKPVFVDDRKGQAKKMLQKLATICKNTYPEK